MSKRWEARIKLVYGSRRTGWFLDRKQALQFALDEIAKHGDKGRIYSVVDKVVYYQTDEDDL